MRLEGGSHPQLEVHHSSLTPEQLISCIMEAEPPEIYLMEDLKKPFTEASMMMSLTNLADKELVLMISWAKKIPGETPGGCVCLPACVSVCLCLCVCVCLSLSVCNICARLSWCPRSICEIGGISPNKERLAVWLLTLRTLPFNCPLL
jgi:hypothetical protein